MLRATVVFCAVLAVAAAGLAAMRLQPIPEKFKGQTGCYIPDMDVVIPFGGSVPSTKGCYQYSCSTEIVTQTGCGTASAGPPCTVVQDESKPHPGCCPTIKCPTNL